MITALLTCVMMLGSVAPRAGTMTTGQRDFKERDEFKQTYQLPQGARVEISSIRGSVKITNSDSATAEVRVIRTARNRADLEYHKIEVAQTGNTLVVRGVQDPRERGERIEPVLPRAFSRSVCRRADRRRCTRSCSLGWVRSGRGRCG